MPDIGETLRDARMRARIDVSEIEAKTKIRAKYLRALENEEWGLLPGPTFVKSFLRTYAQALGLDGKALVEEYRASHEHPSESVYEPIVSSSQRTRGRGGSGRPASGPSRAYVSLVGVVLVLIVLLVIGLLSGGGGGSGHRTARKSTRPHTAHGKRSTGAGRPASAGGTTAGTGSSAIVSLSLQATARVYVCLLGDGARKLIPGTELQPGATTPVYHARRFKITLGNNAVRLLIDGSARTVPPSSLPIGYAITKASGRQTLPQSQLPTCK
ncbi:MAG: hypothetical protein E6G34_04635 [Actinobacteria bacterium]|nr:MAG: hypothetical protein E6G34_04635 [Actinomycetota bacterium]